MPPEWTSLLANLVVAGAMVTLTVFISFWGFQILTHLIRTGHPHLKPHESRGRASILVVLVVFGIFGIHTAQIWLYAALYLLLGELHVFEEALYFSTVTFASLGFGDIVLSERWRVLSAIEAANGVILFAWSTAFLIGVTTRLKLLDHDWLGPER